MKAECDKVNESLNRISHLENESKTCECKDLADMCKGMINIFIDNSENVPDWLKDNVKIEEKTTLVTLGYTNVIYGRYLLAKEEYAKLLAISGQMLEIASIFSNVMYKIYTYIYIALANHYIGKEDKAVIMAEEAVRLAYKDNIVMPFIAFMPELNDLLSKTRGIENDAYYDKFMTNLRERTKKYGKGLSAVKKATLNTQSYGLTKREVEVARLAARRLSNKEIADNLFIAESTVKSNMKIIFSKLGINSRSELKDFFR
jgi:LuxR family maltose regulon positive regulatory protein